MSFLEEILSKIDMPEEAAAETLRAEEEIPEAELRDFYRGLCDERGYDQAYAALKDRLGEDARGFRMLKITLSAAQITQSRYRREGIGDGIFYETMGCFSRFVREYKESFGEYGFDRGFWTGRQLSLLLFRLGSLEYEWADGDVSVHIPGEADISAQATDESLALAARFFEKYRKTPARYVCTSWMLSPALGKLLPADSRLVGFGKRFRILETYPDADDYKLWIYRDKSLSPENFPENTSLQRKAKAYVLGGGKIGSAFGELIAPPVP